MCDFVLENIPADPCPNPAGVTPTMKITDVTQILSIGATVGHVAGTIAMVTTPTAGEAKTFVGLRIDADCKTTQNDDGTYNTEGVLIIPRQAPEKAAFLNTLGKSEAQILEIPLKNGARLLIGSLDHACTVYCDAEAKPNNGYRLRYKWTEHVDLPLHVTGAGIPAA